MAILQLFWWIHRRIKLKSLWPEKPTTFITWEEVEGLLKKEKEKASMLMIGLDLHHIRLIVENLIWTDMLLLYFKNFDGIIRNTCEHIVPSWISLEHNVMIRACARDMFPNLSLIVHTPGLWISSQDVHDWDQLVCYLKSNYSPLRPNLRWQS